MDKTNYILNQDGSFTIKNYNKLPTFSNFLAGISGVFGIPMWVFYVNRAQAIISFGIKDKDHSILEFFPANNAYALAPFVGFRTFIKINKQVFYEPFRVIMNDNCVQEMLIKSNSLEIYERNEKIGLEFSVKYFTLPNYQLAALVRKLTIRNISNSVFNLEILDGLPRIIPFGTSNLFLKELTRTIEAWMYVSFLKNIALFYLIVDPKDTSQTKYIEGANFNYAFYKADKAIVYPKIIVDPALVFENDASYSYPVRFIKEDFSYLENKPTCGKIPCSLSLFNWELKPGQYNVFYSLFGASLKKELIEQFVLPIDAEFLEKKEVESEELIEEIKDNAFVVSNFTSFNHYTRSTYLDNILRGGLAFKFDGSNIYYVFSRKHGDLERDYNKFKLAPSYFSEGEANYRDINQNRRIDLFFNPFIERKNIVYFLNLIKIDGYNPLVVKGEKLFLSELELKDIRKSFNIPNDERLLKLVESGFYLGEFFKVLKEQNIKVNDAFGLATKIVEKAKREPSASFGEGYWIDHWRYNLDLIENYLYFYPDRLKDLFLNREYYFWDDQYRVKERNLRYYLKDGKLYQGHSIEQDKEKELILSARLKFKHFLRTKDKKIYRTNLIVKLFSLILNRCSSFDPDGIGIEMEADKPGWCDSLNGLPALFGSSLCETLELKRASLILLEALEKLNTENIRQVDFPIELASFFFSLNRLLIKYFKLSKEKDFYWWDKANKIKEDFRKKTFFYIEGKETPINVDVLISFLKLLVKKIDIAIEKAKDKNTNLYTTYFFYEVKKFKKVKKSFKPLKFIRHNVALFLEAPVHILRTERDKKVYFAVKNSELFDKELKMYKLNTSLDKEPLEIGRSKIFPPGWLENQSIWLHMEYKYLLEVLKAELYDEFYEDFFNCVVCFFDPAKYGRSILENSSFIVSSSHPDKNLWAKGFVARLTGATVEFLNILMLMCLGKKPFFVDENNRLCVQFLPILKGSFFTIAPQTIKFKDRVVELDAGSFAFSLFSEILVIYHNPKRKDTFIQPDSSKTKDYVVPKKIKLVDKDSNIHTIDSSIITEPFSYMIRDVKVRQIDIYLE